MLATGIVPREDVLDLARKLKITQSADKFFLESFALAVELARKFVYLVR